MVSYSRRILNLRILIKMQIADIPINMRVCGQIMSRPPPFSMTVRLISINQRGGIKLATICKGIGIFLTGKIKPESRILGNIGRNLKVQVQ